MEKSRGEYRPVWIEFDQVRYPNRSKLYGLDWFGFCDFGSPNPNQTEAERVGSDRIKRVQAWKKLFKLIKKIK